MSPAPSNEPRNWLEAHEALSRLAKHRAHAEWEEGRALLAALRAGAHRRLGFAGFSNTWRLYSDTSHVRSTRNCESRERSNRCRRSIPGSRTAPSPGPPCESSREWQRPKQKPHGSMPRWARASAKSKYSSRAESQATAPTRPRIVRSDDMWSRSKCARRLSATKTRDIRGRRRVPILIGAHAGEDVHAGADVHVRREAHVGGRGLDAEQAGERKTRRVALDRGASHRAAPMGLPLGSWRAQGFVPSVGNPVRLLVRARRAE